MILHYYFFQVQRKLWTMLEAKKTPFVQQDMAHRLVVPGGAGGAIDPQILADHSTMYLKQEEQIMPTTLQLAPTDFQALLRPWTTYYS